MLHWVLNDLYVCDSKPCKLFGSVCIFYYFIREKKYPLKINALSTKYEYDLLVCETKMEAKLR